MLSVLRTKPNSIREDVVLGRPRGPRERHVTWRARGVERVAAAASLPASGWAARQAAAPSPSVRRPGVDDAVVCHFFWVESGNCLGILGARSFLLPSVPPAVRRGVFF